MIQKAIREIEKQLPSTTRLVAVSKKQSIDKIMEAYDGGTRIFGENYVQELVEKQALLPKDIEWHLIGHLQTNKVKYIAPFVSMIHSVDSVKLLKEINKQASKANRTIKCLLQVHVAEEDTKTGIDLGEIENVLGQDLTDLANVEIVGLMAMSTFTDDMEQVRREFTVTKELFENLQKKYPAYNLTELSMGMSGDWKIAVELGSTLIRVGSSIFGARQNQ